MQKFKSTGTFYITGRGEVRTIKCCDHNTKWGELQRIFKNKEWIQIDEDVVTIAGIETFAILKDDNSKYDLGLLIGDRKNVNS